MSIKTKNLYVGYGKDQVLKDINLDIQKGDFVTLLGQSGSGKTTLLKALAGLADTSKGEIFIGDKKIGGLGPNQRNISYVFQDLRLFPHLGVYENIAFPLKMHKVPKNLHNQRVLDLLDMVQMSGYENSNISQLSGGQQQRIALARALAVEPEVLLLDEPFSGLDENLRLEMGRLVKDIHEKSGLTSLMVTHDPREATHYSDKIALIYQGRIHQYGTPRQILNEPRDLYTAKYFSEVNIIRGQVEDGVFSSNLGSFPLEEKNKKNFGQKNKALAIFRPPDVRVYLQKIASPRVLVECQVQDYLKSPTEIKLFSKPQGLEENWTLSLPASSDFIDTQWKGRKVYAELDAQNLWVLKD